jgi:hypothetical protein
VGDCWFLSASGAMAEDPQRLMDMFVVKEYNEAGIFAVNFYQLGVPVTVIVDDYVPHYGNRFTTVFAKIQPDEGSTWVTILEKAYAKLVGNYAQMNAGWGFRGIHDLTGWPAVTIFHQQLTQDQVLATVSREDATGALMNSASYYSSLGTSGKNEFGILYTHDYTFLKVEQVTKIDGVVVTLVKMRNPWSKESYIGPWHDYDPIWAEVSQEEKERIGYVETRLDGSFFMDPATFHASFFSTSITTNLKGWKHSYFLMLDDQTSKPGSGFYCGVECTSHTVTITSPVAQQVHIAVHMHDERTYPQGCI